MAFREITCWNEQAELPVLELHSWQRADRWWPGARLSGRPLGMAGAITFHFVLAVILVQITEKSDIPVVRDISSGMKLFDVAAHGATDSADIPVTEPEASNPTKARPADPTSAEAVMPPVEWTVSQVQIARTLPASTVSAAATPAAPAFPAAPASPAPSGSSGFDPYAGASPRRPGESYGNSAASFPMQAAINSGAGIEANRSAMLRAFIIKELKQRFPDLRGTFALKIGIRRGEVSEVAIVRGSMDARTLAWLKSRLRRQSPAFLQTDIQISSVDVQDIILA